MFQILFPLVLINMLLTLRCNVFVPENIHTPPTEGFLV